MWVFFSSLSPTASCPLPSRPLGPGLFGRYGPLSLAKWHLPPVPSAQAGIRFFQETLSAHLGLAKRVIGVDADGMRLACGTHMEYFYCCTQSLSCVTPSAAPWTVLRWASLSRGFFQARILRVGCHFLLQFYCCYLANKEKESCQRKGPGVKMQGSGDFLGGPVVKTRSFQCRGHRFDP